MSLQRTTSVQDTLIYAQYIFDNQDPTALADMTRHGSVFRADSQPSSQDSVPSSPSKHATKPSSSFSYAERPLTRAYLQRTSDSPAKHTRSHHQ
eukprot:m.66468 g.66468  ORF g.66468 m.66468 type:complete len:94 (+) comp14056_c0_seq1:2936-3217(+)